MDGLYGWLNRLERGESAVADSETLDPRRRAHELVYLGLRRNIGINRIAFQARTTFSLDELCGDAIQKQMELGMVEQVGGYVRLTAEGRFVADRVVMEML